MRALEEPEVVVAQAENQSQDAARILAIVIVLQYVLQTAALPVVVLGVECLKLPMGLLLAHLRLVVAVAVARVHVMLVVGEAHKIEASPAIHQPHGAPEVQTFLTLAWRLLGQLQVLYPVMLETPVGVLVE